MFPNITRKPSPNNVWFILNNLLSQATRLLIREEEKAHEQFIDDINKRERDRWVLKLWAEAAAKGDDDANAAAAARWLQQELLKTHAPAPTRYGVEDDGFDFGIIPRDEP